MFRLTDSQLDITVNDATVNFSGSSHHLQCGSPTLPSSFDHSAGAAATGGGAQTGMGQPLPICDLVTDDSSLVLYLPSTRERTVTKDRLQW